jgi:hypothetical protein
VLRSVGAVLGGLATTFVVTTVVDVVLHAAHVFPPWTERMSDALFAVALAYRLLFNVGGSYVTARLAPSRPVAHALALGATGTVLATLGTVAMGEYGPGWYSIANILIAFPCAWAGARLAQCAARPLPPFPRLRP